MFLLNWRQNLAWSLALGGVLVAGTHAQAQQPPRFQVIELREPGDGPQDNVLIERGELGTHWIGIFARPVDEALRAQLKLPEGQGIVVDEVAPESPAAKAGVERFDVLLSVGEAKIASPADLLRSVAQAAGKPAKFVFLRAGAEKTIEITPAERPEAPAGDAFRVPQENLKDLRMWMERMDDPGRGAMHIRGFGPGVMLGGAERPQLPKDVSIRISKTGDQPAEVLVTRGEDKWELSDKPDDLAKLPEDLRPLVAGWLGHAPATFNIRLPNPGDWQGKFIPAPPAAPGIEQRMQKLEEQLERVLKQLEQPKAEAK